MALTKSLREDIESLGQRLLSAAEAEERHKGTRKKGQHDKDTAKKIIAEIKDLTKRIEDAVPLISLSVTASGASLSTAMPESVSPSRLLQASTILTVADQMYMQNPFHERQVGNAFTLTLYQLFAGHAHRTGPKVDEFTWQEVAFKCKVKILRVPLHYGGSEVDNDLGAADQPEHYMRGAEKTDEYAYELRVVEDLDDGRVHEDEGEPYDEVQKAGRRLRVPIHQISKTFYTNSGKLLGIDSITPVLLLKRNPLAEPPRHLLERIGRYERDDDEDGLSETDGPSAQHHDGSTSIHHEPHAKKWEFPEHLDKEWLAFELWQEPTDGDEDDEDDEEEDEESEASDGKAPHEETNYSIASLIPGFSSLLRENQTTPPPKQPSTAVSIRKPNAVAEKPSTSYQRGISGLSDPSLSSLSLLECLLRLTGLQNYQQTSHLFVHDELLNLFLSDSYSDEKSRRRERATAKKKIGFDPFGTPAPPRRGVEFNPTVSVLGQAADFRSRLTRGGTPLDEDSFHEDDDNSWMQEDSPSRVSPRTFPIAQQANPFQGSSPAHSTKSSIRSPAFTSNSVYYSPVSWGASNPSPIAMSSPDPPPKLRPLRSTSSRLKNEVRGPPPASDSNPPRQNTQR